jgi:hypothetical protein
LSINKLKENKVRCKIVENCGKCQHSVGRQSCGLAMRDFDSLERAAEPPDWCPLPIYSASAPQYLSLAERCAAAELIIIRLTMDHNSTPNYVKGFELAQAHFAQYPQPISK